MGGKPMIRRQTPMATPKYPHIKVRLSGQDGNAFTMLGACRRAAERAGLPPEEVKAFTEEATARDHDHLLQTAMRWFNCR
jgi:hypothetical protein